MLALFPSAIVVVALVGLVSDGERTVDTVLDLARRHRAPACGGSRNEGPISEVVTAVDQQSGRRLLLSLRSARARSGRRPGYIGAFTRASNAIYGVEEGRPFYRLRPLQIVMTLRCRCVLLAVVALGLIVSGPVTDAVGDLVGAGGLARDGVERREVAGAGHGDRWP